MEYQLTLAQSDLMIVLQALGELPLKVAVNTFAKIDGQRQAQDAANAMKLMPAGDAGAKDAG